MPAITATNMKPTGDQTVTETTLDGTDTLTFNRSANPVLILSNGTGSPVTPTIDGDGASDVSVQGAGSFDISGGYALDEIPIDGVVAIRLNSIYRYLAGDVAINSGSGLVAQLLEF